MEVDDLNNFSSIKQKGKLDLKLSFVSESVWPGINMTLSSHLSIAKTYICLHNKMFLRDSNGYLESGSY